MYLRVLNEEVTRTAQVSGVHALDAFTKCRTSTPLAIPTTMSATSLPELREGLPRGLGGAHVRSGLGVERRVVLPAPVRVGGHRAWRMHDVVGPHDSGRALCIWCVRPRRRSPLSGGLASQRGPWPRDGRSALQAREDMDSAEPSYGNDWRYDECVDGESQVNDRPYECLPSWRGCAMRRRTRSW